MKGNRIIVLSVFFILVVFMMSVLSCISQPVFHNDNMSESIDRKNNEIIVLSFRDFKAGEENNSGVLVRNVFESRLKKRGFTVVSYEKTSPNMPEIEDRGFAVNSRWVKENADNLKADYVLYGSIYDYTVFQTTTSFLYIFSWLETTYSVGINAKIISSKSGEVVWSGAYASKSYTYNDAARESVDSLIRTIRLKKKN